MCGICGIHDPAGVQQTDVETMMQALRHRGPDDEGLVVDGPAGLGFRRLSIIDLATGHQPMTSADGAVSIVFNGEIYNYRELRERLEGRYAFRTTSDTEALLHLYEEEGERCVDALRGMFGFAILDRRRNAIFLARDHLGQKPLYYVHDGERLLFASEIKALLAVDPGLRELDGEALTEYLTLRIITPPRSMFRRVRKLPPGHTLTFENGKAHIRRYWDLQFQPKARLSYAEAVEELDRRLNEAVRYHLVSDVEVGAFLSGGLDSSMVVAMMAAQIDGPFKTFSGDLPYGTRSELPYARAVAARYGTDSHELTITPALIHELPNVLWHLDEPSDPLSTCLFALSRFISKDVKVVLGGDGGDELFAGYDRYYGQRYAGYLSLLPRAVRDRFLRPLLRKIPGGSWYRSTGHKLRWLLATANYSGAARYAKSLNYFYFVDEQKRALFTPAFRNAVALFDPEENIRRHFDAHDLDEAVDRMLYADSATRLPDHPVMILDRMTMAHGLEARSPFLDHEVAGFCASLPASYKIRGTKRRVIQNALAERYLPREVLTRDKQGFSSAFTYMLAPQFRQLYDTFLGDAHLVRDGYLVQTAIGDLLQEHASGKEDHGNRLWLLYNAELWYRMLIEGDSTEAVQEQMERALADSAATTTRDTESSAVDITPGTSGPARSTSR